MKGGTKIIGHVTVTSLTNYKVKKANMGTGMVYYSGGAGPHPTVIENNDLYLMNYLKARGVDFEYIVHPDFIDHDPEEQFKVIRVGGLLIGFDRWGFCTDQDPDIEDYDQVDFDKIKTAIRLGLARQGKHMRRD